MASKRLTDISTTTGVTLYDFIHIVNTGDTSQDVSGSSYKATIEQVANTINTLIKFTGNTSGDCITDLFVSNVNSCSPLHIQNKSVGDVLIGENGGVNVGIGTNSPNAPLDVDGKIYSRTGGVYTDNIYTYGSGNLNYDVGANSHIFNINGSERFRIDVSGNVGIGTATPISKLHVKGSDSSSSNYGLKVQDSGGTNNFVVRNDGNVGIGTNSPISKLDLRGNLWVKKPDVGEISYLSYDSNVSDHNFIIGYTAGLQSSFQVRDNSDVYIKSDGYYKSPLLYMTNLHSKISLLHESPYDSIISAFTHNTYLFLGGSDSNTSFNVVTSGSNPSLSTKLMTVKGDGNVGIGTTTPSEKLEVNGKTKTTNLQVTSGSPQVGYVLTATDTNGNMTWQEPQDLTKQGTGLTIHFSGKTIFNLPTSPESGNISGDTTNAKLGMIQKIYHQSSVEPTFPATWKLVGEGVYFTDELNIIYAEYVTDTWIEYWIIQQQ